MPSISAPSDSLTYSVTEAARRLGLNKNTVYLLIRKGELPHRRLGGRVLVNKAELDAMFAAGRRGQIVPGDD